MSFLKGCRNCTIFFNKSTYLNIFISNENIITLMPNVYNYIYIPLKKTKRNHGAVSVKSIKNRQRHSIGSFLNSSTIHYTRFIIQWVADIFNWRHKMQGTLLFSKLAVDLKVSRATRQGLIARTTENFLWIEEKRHMFLWIARLYCTQSTSLTERGRALFNNIQEIEGASGWPTFFFFFWGTSFLRKLYLKNFNI